MWRTVAIYQTAELEGGEAVVKERSVYADGKKGPKAMYAEVKRAEKGRFFTIVAITQMEMYKDVDEADCELGQVINMEI